MIWHPKPGQRVRLHYARRWEPVAAMWEGCIGTVRCAARGPGPRNVLVTLDDGRRTIAPRGNLEKA